VKTKNFAYNIFIWWTNFLNRNVNYVGYSRTGFLFLVVVVRGGQKPKVQPKPLKIMDKNRTGSDLADYMDFRMKFAG
jgi:hypothetical protein